MITGGGETNVDPAHVPDRGYLGQSLGSKKVTQRNTDKVQKSSGIFELKR